ncbi:hypothetical protein TBLA_0A02430 [Henningerozyma blattae CBS 6284]|uniref:Phospholipid:diacylglycerol acyltransferase n=1 Tax=Henningerozyma blattae (strain ATCC 34711 / CBS 6284 / DSM 70876 / NBRC 10599 / NRRL Y-10934 / UCD 77-7) TaxID=1071380 RepID=I2GV90_HENB6|nr:hypothetical protein TBLA_0A02430 [Tetrapisispora blattae CBS 6284]CCH58042.1 hypothetical protein TBLA_0A02430 [Tetrapisispora blattae CBS 6284]
MGLTNRRGRSSSLRRGSIEEFQNEEKARSEDRSRSLERLGVVRRVSHHDNRMNEDLILIQAAKKRWRDSRRLVFTLGTLLGILIAFYFGSDHVNNTDLFDKMVNFDALKDYIDDWKDVVPQGFSSFIYELQENYIPSTSPSNNLSENFAVGKQLKAELNITAKHPVIMVPGVISTGIESWGVSGDGECDSTPHFRKRLWGSFYMLRTMVLDKLCWLKHLKLDPLTGLDPENFRMRASQGFESSDFFVAGYWIWNKIIQNLGAIGYDSDKMTTVAYDWRLAYLDLERRDRYFTKVKHHIEMVHDLSGEKVCLVGHSMGAQIVFYFLKWVEAEGPLYGNGGKGWVDKHISSFISIAGTLLGAPKAMPALISGEMKDTIQLNALAMYGLEKFFSRRERLDMLQTWGGIPSMLPKGGNLIWGNKTFSSEDSLKYEESSPKDTYGNFIRFAKLNAEHYRDNMTMEESIGMLLDLSPSWLQSRIEDQYSFGYAKTEAELQRNEVHHSHWTNPLEVPLPNAPNMNIYCIYGINNPTERAYVYKEEKANSSLKVSIDYESDTSVFLTEGDGTVPLISQSMCHKWAEGVSPYNPGGTNVTIVEIKHQPERFDIRGGAKSAEHVDILGSAELNEYLLKIASGFGDTIEPKIFSDIENWVKNIDFPL